MARKCKWTYKAVKEEAAQTLELEKAVAAAQALVAKQKAKEVAAAEAAAAAKKSSRRSRAS